MTAVQTQRVRKVVTTTQSVVPDDDACGDDNDDEVGSHLGSTEWRLLDPCASHGDKFCPLQIGEMIAMPQGMVELPSECITGSRIKRTVRHKRIEPVDEKKRFSASAVYKASLAGHDLDDVPLTGLACGGEFAYIAEANGITIDVGDNVNDDMNDDA